MNFLNKVLKYIKTRGIGFWLLLPAAIIAFVTAFVYMGTFVDGEARYWSVVAFLLPFIAAFAYGLVFYKHTARYAGLVMFVFLLAGLLVTVNTIYYYIADVVFKAGSGVAPGENVDVIAAVGGGVTTMFIFYIIDIILCAVASFFAQYKESTPETADAAETPESDVSATPADAAENEADSSATVADAATEPEPAEEVAP